MSVRRPAHRPVRAGAQPVRGPRLQGRPAPAPQDRRGPDHRRAGHHHRVTHRPGQGAHAVGGQAGAGHAAQVPLRVWRVRHHRQGGGRGGAVEGRGPQHHAQRTHQRRGAGVLRPGEAEPAGHGRVPGQRAHAPAVGPGRGLHRGVRRLAGRRGQVAHHGRQGGALQRRAGLLRQDRTGGGRDRVLQGLHPQLWAPGVVERGHVPHAGAGQEAGHTQGPLSRVGSRRACAGLLSTSTTCHTASGQSTVL
mmetsp:Transcript_14733/g.36739  ORF Transcript_14733/g.36739 Transcript_14733/m.36739 type:complete len:249 (+) Transcript_14733:271-1017(+)